MSGRSVVYYRVLRCFLAIAVLVAVVSHARGETPSVVRVEEDWELVIASPDPDSDGPQITCVMSPGEDLAGLHAAFELNQRTLPDYQAGGMQLQIWDEETPLVQTQPSQSALLATPGETIRWTLAMRLQEGKLAFEVRDGRSTTWGEFGGSAPYKAETAASLLNLNAYSPTVSVRNTGAGFAGNRVRSLVLKRVRYTTATGLVVEDNTPRTVFSQE